MMIKRIHAILVATLLAASLFAGCSSAKENGVTQNAAASAAPAAAAEMEGGAVAGFGGMAAGRDMMAEAEYDEADVEEPEEAPLITGGGERAEAPMPADSARKIIRNVDLAMQTLTFEKAVDDIAKITESYGGYVQNSYVEGRDMYNERGTRTATFSLRVPVEKLDAFVGSFGGDEFNVISKSQHSDDITESYFDSKARLDALVVQEERLMSMLEGATELEYMLQVEKELMNVRYEIESLTSQLQRMDSYVAMSTVNITLYEVVKYEQVEDVPVTFGERISKALFVSWDNFTEFSQDFVVFLIVAFPFLLTLAIIATIIILLVRRARRRSEARRKAKLEAMQPPPPPVEQKPAEPQQHPEQ